MQPEAETAGELTDQVAGRLRQINQRLIALGVPGQALTIVAVTKGGSVAQAEAALANGLGDLGENYAAELKSKAQAVSQQGWEPVRWHYLGKLQSNKINRLAGTVSVWQTIDNLKTARKLARRWPEAHIFIEVNTSGDPRRPGVSPSGVEELAEGCEHEGLDLKGLMCLARQGNPELAEADFAQCAELADSLGLAELSMGMSDDYELAVKHGATMLRLGRILFDPDYPI